MPAVWHWSLAVHATGFVPMHAPLAHASVCVHASASLQLAPSGFGGLEHAPVAGLQVPAVWHWSCAAQVRGAPLLHVPVWQLSPCVQALPSLHGAPFGCGGFEHTPVDGFHVPAR